MTAAPQSFQQMNASDLVTCKFCRTTATPADEPNCASLEEAWRQTPTRPYGCPWFDNDSRKKHPLRASSDAPTKSMDIWQAYAAAQDEMAALKRERAAVIEEAWSTDFSNAPTEMHDYFLVRPRGLSARSDKPFHPTIVQRIDGEFYASDNELEPIYFGQNEADGHPLKTTLEWRHFPPDWTALQPATGGQHG